MDVFVYPIITLLYVVLLFKSYRTFRESSFWGTSWVFFINIALVYENAILSLGGLIGIGSTLEVLNLVRYLLHVLLTPTLVFVSLDILRRIKVEWSDYLMTKVAFHLFTFILTAVGIFTEILWIDLEPVEVNGIIRYIPADMYMPYATILALVPLMVTGMIVWRRLRWPVLLVGTLLAYLGGGIAFHFKQYWVSGLFELLFMWSLVLVEQMLRQEDFQSNWTRVK